MRKKLLLVSLTYFLIYFAYHEPVSTSAFSYNSNQDFSRQWIRKSPSVQTLSISCEPSNPLVVYAGTTQGIYKSTDGGNTWTQKGLNQFVVNSVVANDFGRVVVAIESLLSGVFTSADGGQTWQQRSLIRPPNFEARISKLVGIVQGKIYALASDTGAYRSSDG